MGTTQNARSIKYVLQAKYEGKQDVNDFNKDIVALGKINTIKQLGAEFLELNRKFNESKKKLEEQAKAMRKTGEVTKEMKRSYEQAQKQVSKLSTSIDKKREALKKARTAAQGMSVDTKKLATEEKRLTDTVYKQGSVMAARQKLSVKSNKDIRTEVGHLTTAYRDLKTSGTASFMELYLAKQQLHKKTRELTKDTNIWLSSFQKVQTGALALGGVGYGIIKLFKEYSGFETGMAEVSTLVDVTNEKFLAFKNTAKEVMSDLPQTSRDLTTSLYDIVSAGVPMNEASLALAKSARAATAGVSDTKTAVTAGLGAMNAYGLEIDDLGGIFDTYFTTIKKGVTTFPALAQSIGDVLPQARAASIDLKSVGAAIAALTKAGIKTPQAATALKGAITAMSAPAPEAKKHFDALGISWKGLLPTLEAIADKGLSVEKMRFLIPDSEARTGVLSLTQNLGEFRDILSSMDGASGAMEQAYKKMAATPEHKIKLMTKSLHDMGVSVGNLASTVIVPIAKAIGGLAGKVNSSGTFIKTFMALLGGSITGMILWKLGLDSIVKGVAGVGIKMHELATTVGLYTGAVDLAKAATVRLAAFAMANPVLATISGVVLAASTAWALLGENSHEASIKHAAAAEKIGQGRKQLDKEIETLVRLQKVFRESDPASKKYLETEKELARILPEANISLDKHGNLIAKVGDAAGVNSGKLDNYIDKLKEESRLNFSLQIEQQAKAYAAAQEALQEYKESLANWYGIGGQDDWAAKIWRSVGKLTGTYDENIQKGEEVRGNLYKQKEAYETLLVSMAKTGASSEELSASLEKMHISAELKGTIIESYNKLKTSIDSTKDTTEQSLDSMAAAAEKAAQRQNIAFRNSALAIKGEYLNLATEVKSIMQQITLAEEGLASQLRGIARSGMGGLDAWSDLKKQADEVKAAGLQAAQAGNVDEAIRLLKDAKTLYAQLNKAVVEDGKEIQSHEVGMKAAMEGVGEVGSAILELLNQKKDETIELADELAKKAGIFATEWKSAFENFLRDGQAKIGTLKKELDRLIEEKTLTLNIKTVESKSSGGLVGMQAGGLVAPQRLRFGGAVSMRNGLNGLALSGYGGGDRRHILGEDGEVMLRKEAVKMGSLKAALAFNAGRFDVVIQELMKKIGLGKTIKRNMGGIINSRPALSPIPMAIGGLVSGASSGQGSTNTYNLSVNFSGSIPTNKKQTARELARSVLRELEHMHRGSSR